MVTIPIHSALKNLQYLQPSVSDFISLMQIYGALESQIDLNVKLHYIMQPLVDVKQINMERNVNTFEKLNLSVRGEGHNQIQMQGSLRYRRLSWVHGRQEYKMCSCCGKEVSQKVKHRLII